MPITTNVVSSNPALGRGVLDTKLCDKVCQWLATGWWFSPDTLLSSTNKTDCNDISKILLTVALNTINLSQIYRIKTNTTKLHALLSAFSNVNFVLTDK